MLVFKDDDLELYMYIGRVKNPDFLKEVASLCKKDDHLIVVIIYHVHESISTIFPQINRAVLIC